VSDLFIHQGGEATIAFFISRPQLLELTAADELLAADNVELLRQNGFEVEVAGHGELETGQRHRLELVAQPVSKSTVFDMKGDSLCTPLARIRN
jgi:DNA mismatch repair ATPase MutL